MKGLVVSSLVCLAAAIAWSLWPSGADTGVADGPHTGQAHTGTHPSFTELPELAAREEAAEPGEAAEPADEGEDGVTEPEPDLVTVRGRAVPASGPQPEGVRVMLEGDHRPCTPDDESDDCGRSFFSTTADPETGDFEIQVPPGDYAIVARAEGLLPAGERGLKLSSGETVEGLMLTLTEGFHIRGMVYNEGAPEAGVRVVANGQGFSRSGFTDDQGRFEIEGLPDGEFDVRAYVSFTGGDEKTVHSGGSVTLDLGHRERVRGRVLDAHGFPAEGVTIASDFVVTHYEPNSDPWPDEGGDYDGMDSHGCGPTPDCYSRAVTGADGRFELETAPGEQLIIAATRGDERALVEEITYAKRDEVVLTLEAPRRLKLVDADGKPLKASVTTDNGSVFWSGQMPSDENGNLTMPAHSGLRLYVPFGAHLEGDLPEDANVQEGRIISEDANDPDRPLPTDPPPQEAPLQEAPPLTDLARYDLARYRAR
jgi:hypothetical protein